MPTDFALQPGSLWETTRTRSVEARRSGALQPIPTRSTTIEEGGIVFEVRVVQALEQKAPARSGPIKVDPFLPYDSELFVGELSPTHFVLLNKYSVVDHHVLMVTRAFEDQETLLTRTDCDVLLRSLAEVDGLAFYNAGPIAGGSQPHKHLQLIPLAAGGGPRVPIEPLLAGATSSGTIPGLPYLHAYAPMNPQWLHAGREGVDALRSCYRSLLDAVHMPVESAIGGLERTGPYNLLATRRWLLLVPRTKEYFESISVNALGLAGFLLVKHDGQLDTLRTHGPISALRHVTRPPVVR